MIKKTNIDTQYIICVSGKNSESYDLEDYINHVIKMPYPRIVMNAEVRIAKKVAGILGMKKNRATINIVDKKTKDKLVKQFNFDNKTYGALQFKKYRQWVEAGRK